jgi:hypothetical protein
MRSGHIAALLAIAVTVAFLRLPVTLPSLPRVHASGVRLLPRPTDKPARLERTGRHALAARRRGAQALQACAGGFRTAPVAASIAHHRIPYSRAKVLQPRRSPPTCG